MGVLNPDSEAMQAAGRIADYIIINLLCIIFSIPIVTCGAAMSAKYYVSMKMVRGEEPEAVKAFWSAFKSNFKQATKIWIVAGTILGILAWDWYGVLYGGTQNMILVGKITLLILTLIVWAVIYSIFPFIARFEVTTKEAFKGAVVFALLNFPKMFIVLIVGILPYIIGVWYIQWALAIWLFITTVALYYISKMFVSEFKKLEDANMSEKATE